MCLLDHYSGIAIQILYSASTLRGNTLKSMYMSVISSKNVRINWTTTNVALHSQLIFCHLNPNPTYFKSSYNTYDLFFSSIFMYFNTHNDITANSCKIRPLPVASTSNYYQSEDAFVPLVHTNQSTTYYCYNTANWSGHQNV